MNRDSDEDKMAELTRQVSLILSIRSGDLIYRLTLIKMWNKKNTVSVQLDLARLASIEYSGILN